MVSLLELDQKISIKEEVSRDITGRENRMDKYLKRLTKKANPIVRMLTSTTFRQQTLASKKLYDRNKIKEEDLKDEKNNV